MKIRSFLIVLIAVLVSVCIGAGPAWAGNVQRNRWEGLAIGIGEVMGAPGGGAPAAFVPCTTNSQNLCAAPRKRGAGHTKPNP